jgi:hypothetical protein
MTRAIPILAVVTACLIGHAAIAVELRFIDPTTTGPGIRDLLDFPPNQVKPEWALANRSHLVAFDPSAGHVHRLFVFLAGSGGLPAYYQRIVARAAELGFHAVSLAYPNWPAVRDLLAQETDPLVAGSIRRERLYGVDEYPGINVDYANSVQNRLTALLAHQHAAHPDEGWDQFLSDTATPAWPLIVVAGHSQGAGHAAYLTRDQQLAGALMFGGPGDFVSGQQAAWLFRPAVTPADRMFAFTHADDPSFGAFILNQRTLGLNQYGPAVDVDTTQPPYAGSHMLYSRLAPPPGQNPHNAVVVDAALRLDDHGRPIYEPVWDYMLNQVVPEPATLALLAAGALTMLRCRSRLPSTKTHSGWQLPNPWVSAETSI